MLKHTSRFHLAPVRSSSNWWLAPWLVKSLLDMYWLRYEQGWLSAESKWDLRLRAAGYAVVVMLDLALFYSIRYFTHCPYQPRHSSIWNEFYPLSLGVQPRHSSIWNEFYTLSQGVKPKGNRKYLSSRLENEPIFRHWLNFFRSKFCLLCPTSLYFSLFLHP